MEYVYANGPDNLGRLAARWVAREILKKPDAVLGLPTGSTPVVMYQVLARMVEEGLISFAKVQTFNLDDYIGLGPNHPNSFSAFMTKHLWGKIDLPRESAHIPDGNASDLDAECRRYDNLLDMAGGLGAQILGLGSNGHIGFNEPSDKFALRTHVVNLTMETIKSNARFFSSIEHVPKQAITMGLGSIMQARRVLLLIVGESKKEILRKTLFDPVSFQVPSSILQLHSDLTVITDIDLDTLLKKGSK